MKQLKLDLRRWLAPPDFSTNHNIARNVHHKGTATWFFQGEVFNEWKINPSLLWIHGKRTFLPYVALRFTESDLRSGLWKEHYVVCEPPFLILYTG